VAEGTLLPGHNHALVADTSSIRLPDARGPYVLVGIARQRGRGAVSPRPRHHQPRHHRSRPAAANSYPRWLDRGYFNFSARYVTAACTRAPRVAVHALRRSDNFAALRITNIGAALFAFVICQWIIGGERGTLQTISRRLDTPAREQDQQT